MVELREQERKAILALRKLNGRASIEDVIVCSGLSDSAVMRAAVALQEKKLLKISVRQETIATVNDEGKSYAKNGLPERRMIDALKRLGGKASLGEIIRNSGLQGQFIPIALGWIQRKNWATLDGKAKVLQITDKLQEGADEKLLKILGKSGHVTVDEIDSDLRSAVQVLKGRKLVEVTEKTRRVIEMTQEGWTASEKALKATKEVTQLTPELIISGKWKKVKLQKYDIAANVSHTWPGKKHPYLAFLDEVKRKLVNLGFKEMTGTFVETAFFNFDALYTPQDHPARESYDVYFIKSPKYGTIHEYQSVVRKVKETHENGCKTGSTGWRYKYSIQEARRLLLRGHTTCLSARTLLSKDLETPGKYFSIGRCYRPDVPDKTHLTEFNQVEGIVVDENLTLRDLLGILEKFAVDIAGAEKFRLRPDYYPFTEPSVELSAYKEDMGWVEFGGSGMFRPEVTSPLGIKVPVIAWGLGIDRLFMIKAKVDDIRYLFAQDLDWIRRKEVV